MAGAMTDQGSDLTRIRSAGEGATVVKNPFEDWLPTFSNEDEYNTAYPGNTTARATAGNGADALIAKAKAYVGTPYKWGGTSPLGFDCSGFTQYVYKSVGVDVPRLSYQQANSGKRIGLNELKPGDLVAWDNSTRNNGADHVGIYLGDGMVIHAPKPGDSVKISKMFDADHAWGVAMNL